MKNSSAGSQAGGTISALLRARRSDRDRSLKPSLSSLPLASSSDHERPLKLSLASLRRARLSDRERTLAPSLSGTGTSAVATGFVGETPGASS